MPVTGTPGDDDIQLPQAVSFEDVNLGQGQDILRLADGNNFVFVSETERVIGGAGNDSLVASGPGLEFFDGRDGTDELYLGSLATPVVLQRVERVYGDVGASDVTLQVAPGAVQNSQASTTFSMEDGYDRLTVMNRSDTRQSVVLNGVEEVRVDGSRVDVYLQDRADGFRLTSTPGSDATLNLDFVSSDGSVSNTVTSIGRNTILGSAGRDVVDVLDGSRTVFVGRGGEDAVRVFNSESRLELTDVATVQGSKGSDSVVLTLTEGQQFYARNVDLGGGQDSLEIRSEASSATTVYVSGAEKISVVGYTGLYLQDRAFGTLVTAGEDSNARVVLADVGGFKTANLLEVAGSVTVIGSEGRDIVRAQEGPDGGVYALGGGLDRLEMTGSGSHMAFAIGVEAVLGGTGNDTLFVEEDTPENMSIDLGGGVDRLYLSDTGGSVLVSNVEELFGNSNQDTVTVRTSAKGMTLDLGDGFDRVYLQAVNNSLTVRNTEFVVGGAGVDRITVAGGDATSLFVNAQGGGDVIVGGAGNDVIIGGLGKDLMTGGAGADVFLFERVADSDLNTRDIIYDFTPGQDRLEFQGLLHGQFQLTVEPVFTFFVANGNSQAHFMDSTDQLLIDSDGDGAMDMRMALLGVDGSQLTTADFAWSLPMGGPPGSPGPIA